MVDSRRLENRQIAISRDDTDKAATIDYFCSRLVVDYFVD